jgi:hypothetical protein
MNMMYIFEHEISESRRMHDFGSLYKIILCQKKKGKSTE